EIRGGNSYDYRLQEQALDRGGAEKAGDKRHGRIQPAGTDVAGQTAIRNLAEEDAGNRGRGLGWRRYGYGEDGRQQAGAEHQDRSRGSEVRRSGDAAGPD